jgi:hypothetical protein
MRLSKPALSTVTGIMVGVVGILVVALTIVAILLFIKVDAQVGRVDAGLRAQKAERARNTLSNCLQTNMRHDATIAALDRQIRSLPPAQQAGAQIRRAATVELIEALSPKRDCVALTHQQVR